ncbi:hypothetical protein VNO77_24667 [Canavalia gladiata]|uniref:Uncharacterized protein n=1 Tax=Canavalia gladiata TaxID=3824 RepID=A0AAN9L993_CANGL
MVHRPAWIYHKLESSFKFLALDPRAYFDKTEGRGSLTAYKLFLSSHRVEVILDHESMMPWLTYDWFILYACHRFPLSFLFPRFVPAFCYDYARILPPIQTTLPRADAFLQLLAPRKLADKRMLGPGSITITILVSIGSYLPKLNSIDYSSSSKVCRDEHIPDILPGAESSE